MAMHPVFAGANDWGCNLYVNGCMLSKLSQTSNFIDIIPQN